MSCRLYKKCTVALSLCRFWNFDTFLQKVKNAHYYWSFFWHFDTPDKTRNYQKDRKRQSDKSFKVSKYHVIWYFPKLGLTLAATPAHIKICMAILTILAISPISPLSPVHFFLSFIESECYSDISFNTPYKHPIVSDKLVIRWIFVSHCTTHYVP